MECWRTARAVEYWSFGVVEDRRGGEVLERWRAGVVESWSIGDLEGVEFVGRDFLMHPGIKTKVVRFSSLPVSNTPPLLHSPAIRSQVCFAVSVSKNIVIP